ncbi:MAG: class I SAM-dependent methyltransferase [Burkholderiales bacterium]|nr:class I SAM-dependent methyltransferase [Burkholderiales bacterium]
MPNVNAQQIAEWNGPQGQRWAELQQQTDRLVGPFGAAALARAAPQPAEGVLDIGCGCGETSFELARRVGPRGWVLGLDISRPMLEAARRQAAGESESASASKGESEAAGRARLEFREGDAATAPLPAGADLLYSRFGLMFFDQPAAALRHLRGALRPGGRLAFVCWRSPRDNPWAMTPLVAARQALGVVAEPADPLAPGPFAFADEARLRALLAEAGWAGIELQRFDAAVTLGPSPRAAAENATRIGPTSRLVREVGLTDERPLLDALERAFAPLAAADGAVRLAGSTWIASAVNP